MFRTLNGLRRWLGTAGALRYIKDYHQSRIHADLTWDDAVHLLWRCGTEESDIVSHANFMNDCGTDLYKYKTT
jgi:hypothetical protein